MRKSSKRTSKTIIITNYYSLFSATNGVALFGGGGAGLLNGLCRLGGGCGVTSLSDVASTKNYIVILNTMLLNYFHHPSFLQFHPTVFAIRRPLISCTHSQHK